MNWLLNFLLETFKERGGERGDGGGKRGRVKVDHKTREEQESERHKEESVPSDKKGYTTSYGLLLTMYIKQTKKFNKVHIQTKYNEGKGFS